MNKKLTELGEQLDRISDIVSEHNKSLNILHDTLIKMNDAQVAFTTRLAELEAKTAYFVNQVESKRIVS